MMKRDPVTTGGEFRRDNLTPAAPDDPGPSSGDIRYDGPQNDGHMAQTVAIVAAIVLIGASGEMAENGKWLIMAAQGALGIALGLLWRRRGR